MNRLIISVSVICFLTACVTPKQQLKKSYSRLSKEERVLADSVILYALDHEALYTLADTLKPMSSVRFYQLPLAGNKTDDKINTFYQLQKVSNALSRADFEFVFNPYKYSDTIHKNMEMYVFRKSRLKNMITQQQAFYLPLGINPDALPATVLAITEYGNKYERWQSYGYLFGYPDHAVDFFVQAGKQQDTTTEFVERSFFAIPVQAGETGYFTYAIPKGAVPSQQDSTIYLNAQQTLHKYKELRSKVLIKKNRSPFKLWMKML
ncbi:hypothetical protein [Gynurincola endophyticus]|uniref:hypothetical protein n=1 Tax=Gynurincola endophyticus TaxID=2479004 RepID=UPI000F8EF6AE|nr:hypothetical protein [Gynurincola endophyticus]